VARSRCIALALLTLLAAPPLTAQDVDTYRRDRATELTTLGARFLEAGDRVSAAGYFRPPVSADPG